MSTKKDVEEKQAILDTVLHEKDGFARAQAEVEKVLEEKQSVFDAKRDVHSEKVTAQGEKLSALKQLQKAQQECDAAVKAVVAKRHRYKSVATETLAKVNGES